MNIKTLKTGPLEVNCYIVTVNNETFIIDPGDEHNKIIAFIENAGLNAKAILLTHAHIDHCSATFEVATHFNIPVVLHEDDINLYNSPANSLEPFYPPLQDRVKTQGNFENSYFTIIHTPGHSAGSVCYYFKNRDLLFGGDTLFYESIGRTDLPGGNYNSLMDSIKNKLFKLPETTVIYPGHGPSTTISHEMRHNPFIN